MNWINSIQTGDFRESLLLRYHTNNDCFDTEFNSESKIYTTNYLYNLVYRENLFIYCLLTAYTIQTKCGVNLDSIFQYLLNLFLGY